MQVDVRHCARCGKDHHSLEFARLDRPISENGRQWTHWATCPVTGDSILMREEIQARKRPGPSETKDRS